MTIRHSIHAFLLTLLAWIGLMIGVTFFSNEAPFALVLFPSKAFLEQVPDDISVISYTQFSLTLASDETDLPYQLYRSGAWIVLPAGLQGCFTNLS